MTKDPDPSSQSIQPVVTIVKLHDNHSDIEYWQTQPYTKRFATVEELSSQYSIQSSKGGYIVLTSAYKDFIQSIYNHQVRYLVVGGYAVALHSYPRFTKDIGIWIDLPRMLSRWLKHLIDLDLPPWG